MELSEKTYEHLINTNHISGKSLFPRAKALRKLDTRNQRLWTTQFFLDPSFYFSILMAIYGYTNTWESFLGWGIASYLIFRSVHRLYNLYFEKLTIGIILKIKRRKPVVKRDIPEDELVERGKYAFNLIMFQTVRNIISKIKKESEKEGNNAIPINCARLSLKEKEIATEITALAIHEMEKAVKFFFLKDDRKKANKFFEAVISCFTENFNKGVSKIRRYDETAMEFFNMHPAKTMCEKFGGKLSSIIGIAHAGVSWFFSEFTWVAVYNGINAAMIAFTEDIEIIRNANKVVFT